MRKVIAMVLVFSMMVLSVYLYAKIKGTDAAIQKKDVQSAQGKHTGARTDSLFLQNSESEDSESANRNKLKAIDVAQKIFIFIGLLGLALLGNAIGSTFEAKVNPDVVSHIQFQFFDE